MNTKSNHFQSLIKRHYGAFGDQELTTAISDVDLHIINELIELFKKLNKTNVVALMNNYKKEPDELILADLMDINTQTNFSVEVEEGEGEEKKLPYWIHFNDQSVKRIQRQNLISFSKDSWIGKNNEQFSITLNETPIDVKQVPFHANEILYYNREDIRDEDFEFLESLKNY